jgi:hypothetical protein
MDWRCKIGWHDWETVLRAKKHFSEEYLKAHEGKIPPVFDRACLRPNCSKIELDYNGDLKEHIRMDQVHKILENKTPMTRALLEIIS